MTWHHYRSSIPLPCGSCKRELRGTREAPVVYARVTAAKLIRCQDCAERIRDDAEELRGVCAWPRVMTFDDAYPVPAPTLPGVFEPMETQPFAATGRRKVRDYKSQQWSENA